MNKISNNFTSIEQVTNQFLDNKTKGAGSAATFNGLSFGDLLSQKANPVPANSTLKFSKHATARLGERDISLSAEQSLRLNQGVEMASEKGIKDSLVLVDSLAFIVNVPNQTVITAMDSTQAQENIYTNIDGAVIA